MTLKDNNNGTFSIVAPCSFEKQEPVAWESIQELVNEADDMYEDLIDSWQLDMENGVKWLNEKAVEEFKKKYPALNVSISRTMSFLNKLADFEYATLQTKPLNDDEIKAIENSVKYSELALSNDEYMLKFAKAIEKAHGIQKSVE